MFYPTTYTVESVTSGHPDKICDRISDAVLDACVREDPKSRVAVECFGCHGSIVVGGEITTNASIDFAQIARSVYRDTGYADPLDVSVRVARQSPDISRGVDHGGAGDQGIMYGYATNETREFLPAAVVLAHRLAHGLEKLRARDSSSVTRTQETRLLPWLKPDGKTQVTMQNDEIRTVLVSCQHEKNTPLEEIKHALMGSLVRPLLGDGDYEVLVNPTGAFEQGGFEADTGLTGRKLMVDTYGGLVPHGGGCFSGKDATKVDRSGAYMARYVAKNVVAAGLAKKTLVSVAYAIGRAEPLMVHAYDERGRDFSDLIQKKFDFRPAAIIERLGLREPIFLQTAAYGHFGKEGLPWERLDITI